MRQLLTPPRFDDEAKTHQAFLLHVILWSMVLVPVPYVLVTLIFTPHLLGQALAETAVGETANVVLLVLLRRGHVRLAARLQVAAFWFFCTVLTVSNEGVYGPAYLLGYGVVIVIAGVLLGGREAMIVTTLSLLAGAGLVYAELNGWLAEDLFRAPVLVWIISGMMFSVSVVLQYLASSTVQRALARARASEAHYRSLIEESPQGILIIDQQPAIVRANPAAGQILGYDPAELVGRDPRHLIDPADLAARPIDFSALLAGQTIRQERWLVRRDGSRLPVMGHHKQMPDGGYQYIFQDISEQKRVDEERARLIGELEAKNAELERFTYTVSHDLKAPLVTIRGFLGFLEKDAGAGHFDRMKADMARIVEATGQMDRLLRELLELSRIGRLTNPSQAVPFAVITGEAVSLVRGSLDAGGVSVEIAPDLPVVYGDRTRLVEVVQNLIDNAVKFMGDQPAPRVEIGHNGRGSAGQFILFVRDNGIGIEPRYQEQVFDLFSKLDAASPGSGVGLALVKRIVEVHGGRIWLESAGRGQGSTFYFSLPGESTADG